MSERTRRLAAPGLDYLVVLGLVTAIIFLARGELPDALGRFGPIGSELPYFPLLTFVDGFHLCRTESGPRRRTWGKRRMGLEVVGLDGPMPRRTQVLLRTVVKLLPWETAHFFIWQFMGVIYREGQDATPRAWIFAGMHTATAAAIVCIVIVLATGRGPHDLAAGTKVGLRAVPAS